MDVCYIFIKIKKDRSLKLTVGLAGKWLWAFRVLRYMKGLFRYKEAWVENPESL
jgi:hypothetical protein